MTRSVRADGTRPLPRFLGAEVSEIKQKPQVVKIRMNKIKTAMLVATAGVFIAATGSAQAGIFDRERPEVNEERRARREAMLERLAERGVDVEAVKERRQARRDRWESLSDEEKAEIIAKIRERRAAMRDRLKDAKEGLGGRRGRE